MLMHVSVDSQYATIRIGWSRTSAVMLSSRS